MHNLIIKTIQLYFNELPNSPVGALDTVMYNARRTGNEVDALTGLGGQVSMN